MALSHSQRVCSHGLGIARSYAGMTVQRVTAGSVVFRCQACNAGVRVARCSATTRTGVRCKLPVRPMFVTCYVHKDAAVKLSDVLEAPHHMPDDAKAR